MSKIGRKAIDISGLQVSVHGQVVEYKGPKASGVYRLPEVLKAEIVSSRLLLVPAADSERGKNRLLNAQWGLHRALLANKMQGARKLFATEVQINGLGFKAVPSGGSLIMSLGYSHKINFPLPEDVVVSVDKLGQKLIFESSDKVCLGATVGKFRALKEPNVYKGTGIKRAGEVLVRKAGKKKA
jgi:large subunit ribosomal protein L6